MSDGTTGVLYRKDRISQSDQTLGHFVTGCWGPASGHDLTDVSGRSWNLTGSDQMLGSCVRSWHCAASGHHLTVGIGRLVFEERDDVATIR